MAPRDERGVTPLVGMVLLLGILMLALTLYQVQIVPTDNKYHEFQHSKDVQRQLQMAHTDMLAAGATGESRTQTVELGMSYPVRVWAINPPPVSGTIRTRTTGPGAVGFENVTATAPETAQYWNTSRRSLSYSTRQLVYSADYHVYSQAPTTVIANSRVYNRHSNNTTQVLTPSSVVEGRDLSLVTLTGNLSRSQVDATTLDIRARSPSASTVQAITVTGVNGRNPRVRLPTRLPASKWRSLLADELDPNGTESEQYVRAIEPVSGANAVELVLEADATYTLRLASVRVGSGGVNIAPPPAYLTHVRGPETTLTVDQTRQFVVEARDRFNNPVGGVNVTATISGTSGGTFARTGTQTATVETTPTGRAVFTFDASGVNPPANVTIDISTGPNASETVTYAFEVASTAEKPPAVQSVTAPEEVTQGEQFALKGHVTDVGRGGSDIIGSEWYRAASPSGSLSDPGTGSATAMRPGDGQFDAPRERVVRTVDTSGWQTGNHTLAVRGRDGTGQWGATRETVVTVVSGLAAFSVSDGTAVDVNEPGAGASGVYSGVRFNITNQQNTSVAISAIRVSVANGTANNLEERVSGQGSPWTEEVHIAGDLQSGGNDTSHSFDLGSNITVSPAGEISSSGTGTVYLLKFEKGDSGVDMRNRTLLVTIYYGGQQSSFEVDITKQDTASA